MRNLWKPRGGGRPLAAVLAAGIAIVLLVGYVQPARAADEVTFSDEQVSSVLFGGAVRILEAGPAYEKTTVLSAELMDWRARNSEASPADVTAHLTRMEQAVDQLPQAVREGQSDELLRAQLKAVYAVPGAVIAGPMMTGVLAASTGRDLNTGILEPEERVNGAQQQYGVGAGNSTVQWRLWSEVRSRSLVDTTLQNAWQATLGKPTDAQPAGLNPTWSLETLKNYGNLKNLVDTDALRAAGKAGKTDFLSSVKDAANALQTKLGTENDKLKGQIDKVLQGAGLPALPNGGPTDAQLSQAKKDQASRQAPLDGIKGGLDALSGLVSLFDSALGKKIAAFADTAYKIATQVNQLYTSIATLAASTGIGLGTFGVIGGAIGAVVGLVQIGISLFSSDQPDAAQQAIMQQLKTGFDMVKQYLQTIYEVMNKRFDRIDASLNAIYSHMMSNFATVIGLLYDVNGSLNDVHAALLSLASQVQTFNEQLFKAVVDTDKATFHTQLGKYVDYEHKWGHPIPSYDTDNANYVDAVNAFTIAANRTSRNATFIYQTDNAQTDALTAINAHGPVGAIDFLAARAREFGLAVPVSSARTPNADMWGQGARAYTLTALQNLRYSVTEKGAADLSPSAEQILANGRLIRDTALKFSAPMAPPATGTWTATNSLFSGLLAQNAQRSRAFGDSLTDLETNGAVMRGDRKFDLWGGVRQAPVLDPILTVDKTKLADVPPKTGRCENAATVVPTPAAVTGRSMPKALLLGLYADPDITVNNLPVYDGWTYGVCWTKPRYDGLYVETVPQNTIDPETGEVIDTRYVHTQIGYLTVDFNESVDVPVRYGTAGRILGRTTAVEDTKAIRLCTWRDGDEISEAQPPSCAANRAKANDFAAAGNYTRQRSAGNVSQAGDAAAGRFLELRQANYYALVADRLNDPTKPTPAEADLNENTRMIEAYTDLGFPRAVQTDDQLHALLYGTNSLPADLTNLQIQRDIYALSAEKARAGKPLFADQPLLEPQSASGCTTTGLRTKDPVAACVVWIGDQRRASLAARYEVHSRAIYNKQEVQTLPMVDEAITNLELVSQYVRTYAVDNGPRPSATPTPGRAPARAEAPSTVITRPEPMATAPRG